MTDNLVTQFLRDHGQDVESSYADDLRKLIVRASREQADAPAARTPGTVEVCARCRMSCFIGTDLCKELACPIRRPTTAQDTSQGGRG